MFEQMKIGHITISVAKTKHGDSSETFENRSCLVCIFW